MNLICLLVIISFYTLCTASSILESLPTFTSFNDFTVTKPQSLANPLKSTASFLQSYDDYTSECDASIIAFNSNMTDSCYINGWADVYSSSDLANTFNDMLCDGEVLNACGEMLYDYVDTLYAACYSDVTDDINYIRDTIAGYTGALGSICLVVDGDTCADEADDFYFMSAQNFTLSTEELDSQCSLDYCEANVRDVIANSHRALGDNSISEGFDFLCLEVDGEYCWPLILEEIEEMATGNVSFTQMCDNDCYILFLTSLGLEEDLSLSLYCAPNGEGGYCLDTLLEIDGDSFDDSCDNVTDVESCSSSCSDAVNEMKDILGCCMSWVIDFLESDDETFELFDECLGGDFGDECYVVLYTISVTIDIINIDATEVDTAFETAFAADVAASLSVSSDQVTINSMYSNTAGDGITIVFDVDGISSYGIAEAMSASIISYGVETSSINELSSNYFIDDAELAVSDADSVSIVVGESDLSSTFTISPTFVTLLVIMGAVFFNF